MFRTRILKQTSANTEEVALNIVSWTGSEEKRLVSTFHISYEKIQASGHTILYNWYRGAHDT